MHFRVGRDYLIRGYRLKQLYWIDAAEYMKQELENPLFVCVYDKKTKFVEKFIKEYNALDMRGSLIEDMCTISMCDANIVCNSSFSVMSALLNKKAKIVVCPSKYPVEGGIYLPDHVFPKEWVRIGNGKRELLSAFLGACRDNAAKVKRFLFK